jgi:NADH-quinone oxidoreductase subunit J
VLHETIRGQRPAAAILVALLLGGTIWALFLHPFRGPGVDLNRVANNDNVRAIGQLLFTRYLFAFEATGLLLVVAAVGALVLGKRPVLPRARERAARTSPAASEGGGPPGGAREQEPVP